MLEALAAFAQALVYAGVLWGAGGALAAATLELEGVGDSVAKRAARRGAVVTIAASLLWLAILVQRLAGGLDMAVLGTVLGSNVGAAIGLRVCGALLLLVTPAPQDAFGRGMQWSAAVVVVASFAFSGHAAALGLPAGLIAAAHVAFAAWWVGGLLVLRAVCASASPAAGELLRRFSVRAFPTVLALIAAGVVLIVVLIDFPLRELTAYARHLATKLALVAAVLGLAAYNRWGLTARALEGDARTLDRLRRSTDMELVLIALVLAATSVLTTYTSPHA